MATVHWDEGQSWSCLPHAVVGFAFAFADQAQGYPWESMIPLGIGIAFLFCRSGCSWDSDSNTFRSYNGWIAGRRHVVWGKRVEVSYDAPLRLEHTRGAMMNRRGAPQSVRIESWELQWLKPKGVWSPLHDFVDSSLAEEVLSVLRNSRKQK